MSTVGPNALYVVSQRALYPDWRHRLRWFPLLMGVGVGLALSNSRAVAEALSGKQSEFVRTPKSGGRARQRYRVRTPILPWIELLLGLYCAVSLGAYVGLHRYVLGPFLLIYAGGFFLTGWLGLREARLQRVASLAATRIPAAPASSPAADQRTPPRAALPLPASAPLALRSWRRPEVYGSAAAPEKS